MDGDGIVSRMIGWLGSQELLDSRDFFMVLDRIWISF